MDKVIKTVLDKIEDAGFSAYIIGGYVRDMLLGNNSLDIDICSDALPKDIKRIFDLNIESDEYGSINFRINEYNFDITTFREDIKYFKRKPVEINYIKDLYTDILRRDFTINIICMNNKSELIDLLNGKDDILNRKIKLIGDVSKLKDDPLRILRAIRFATILNFNIDVYLNDGIFMYKELVKTLSKNRIKKELDKILVSKNSYRGLDLINKYGLKENLGISYNDIQCVEDLNGMWAQIETTDDYPFTKAEKSNIKQIKEVLTYGKIDNYILFKYGLYISTIAGKIMGIDKELINSKYNELQIKNISDLCITIVEINDILNSNNFNVAHDYQKKIIDAILDNKLNNNKEEIIRFINS